VLPLVNARSNETEGEYNERAAAASAGELALLDARPVPYGGGRSRIEVCDLLSRQGTFVHLKAKTKSSTLSHLFAQGLNSAQAFRDAAFRALARAICPTTHQYIFDGEPRPSNHTIVYAIISSAEGNIRDALPFFSRQSLANANQALINMGYNVRLRKVPVQPNASQWDI
jgi:uncharacterized protein (TIGR04141 family)